MIYKGYTIEQDNTGWAPKTSQFAIFLDEKYIDSAGSIEECKVIIDEIINEEADYPTEIN